LNSGTNLNKDASEIFDATNLDKMAKFQTAHNPRRKEDVLHKQSNSEMSNKKSAQRFD
jgi:hypothetical protein